MVRRATGWGLLVLATGMTLNALLGPLVLGVIDYRYGESMTSQGLGLDVVVLTLVVPVTAAAGVLTLRRHEAGPLLALGPAAFAAYMLPQYAIGPEYARLPGNNERFLALHLALFVLALGVLLACWAGTDGSRLPPRSARSDRRRAWVVLAVAAFVLLRWAPALVALARGRTDDPGFQDNATAFLLVGWLDLGLVVPAALVTAVGLRRGSAWGRKSAYAVLGWFALVPASVAAMAVAMQLRDDPDANGAATTLFAVVAVLSLVAAAGLYRPLLAASAGRTVPGETAIPPAGGRSRDRVGSV